MKPLHVGIFRALCSVLRAPHSALRTKNANFAPYGGKRFPLRGKGKMKIESFVKQKLSKYRYGRILDKHYDLKI